MPIYYSGLRTWILKSSDPDPVLVTHLDFIGNHLKNELHSIFDQNYDKQYLRYIDFDFLIISPFFYQGRILIPKMFFVMFFLFFMFISITGLTRLLNSIILLRSS